MATLQHHNIPPDQGDPEAMDYIHEVTPEAAYAYFDTQARAILNISAEEFLPRWDAGEFRPVPDTREYWKLGRLVMLIPLARPRQETGSLNL